MLVLQEYLSFIMGTDKVVRATVVNMNRLNILVRNRCPLFGLLLLEVLAPVLPWRRLLLV